MPTDTILDLGEEEVVWAWRIRCFKELGFDHVDAEVLAESDADLHEMKDLLDEGCSHELAASILT